VVAPFRGGVPLTPPAQHWACPCGRTAITQRVEPHSQLHPCHLVGGLLTPFAPVGARWQPGDPLSVNVVVNERQDYERHAGLVAAGRHVGETLTRDDRGKPAMGVSVEYADGAAHALFVPGVSVSGG